MVGSLRVLTCSAFTARFSLSDSSREDFTDHGGVVFDAVEGGEMGEVVFGVRVDAEGFENRGKQVLFVEWFFDGFVTLWVGRADDDASLEPAARHREAPGGGVMLAAVT